MYRPLSPLLGVTSSGAGRGLLPTPNLNDYPGALNQRPFLGIPD
jgi:hypothetical protein